VIPLSDGAGEVATVGDEVTRVKVGDRIAGCFHPRWFGGPIKPDYLTDRLGANLDGMLAEYAVLSEEALVDVPSHLRASAAHARWDEFALGDVAPVIELTKELIGAPLV
jgi:NADPH:quinone reductase-like Zn-dependent oxidoreductase